MKILYGAIIVIVVLFIIVSIIGIFYLGPIVKVGIERFGPQITKVSVLVDSVSVSPLSGSASVKGLVVGNPTGYSNPQAINITNATVSLDPYTLTSNKILIHSIHIDSPEITYQIGLGGSNLNKILSNVNSSAQSPQASQNNTNNNGKPASNIEIDDFLITNAKVRVAISGVGGQLVPLPQIHLTNLGKDNKGLSTVEITRVILTAVVTQTIKTVASSAGTIKNTVSTITSTLGNSLGNLLGNK